jgi:hypothetical protein
MKPTANYRMSSMTKMSLATITDPQKRSEWKRAMIGAELAAAVVPKTRERNDKQRPQGTAGYKTNDTGTAATAQ